MSKKCSKCGRELPATADYFHRQSRLKSGLTAACKECAGKRFTDKDPKPKDGYKICCRCKQELPATPEYFSSKKGAKYGVRESCRECSSEYNRQYKLKNKEQIAEYNAKYHEEHKEQIRAYTASRADIDRQYRIENSDHISAYKKQYAIDNKEVLSAYKREYYLKNKEQLKEYQKERRRANPEEIRARDRELYGERKSDPEFREQRKNHAKTLKSKPGYIEQERARHRAYRQTPEGKLRARIDCIKRRTVKRQCIATLTPEEWQSCLDYFDNKDAYTGLAMEIISQDHVIPLSEGGSYACSNIVPCEMSINSSKNDNDMVTWYKQQPFFSQKRLRKILKWTGLKPDSDIQQISMF